MLDVIIQLLILALALLIAGAKSVQFSPNELSEFELQRRAGQRDKAALQQQELRANRHLFIGLQRLMAALLMALMITILMATYPLVLALIFVVLWLLVIELLAAVRQLARLFEATAQRHQPLLVRVTRQLSPVLRFFAPRFDNVSAGSFFSKEELLSQLDGESAALPPEEKRLLAYALTYKERRVRDAMTPRAKIITINRNETIGPLLLDRLHKVGRMFLPVIDKDLDHIIGVLNVHSLMPLNPALKEVGEAMNPRLFYIHQDQPLAALIAAFLRTGQHLFIVINDSEEAVGIITIEDVLRQLVGSEEPRHNLEYEDPHAIAKSGATASLSTPGSQSPPLSEASSLANSEEEHPGKG